MPRRETPSSPDKGKDAPPIEPSGRFTFELTGHTRSRIDGVWEMVGVAGRWKDWAWMTRTFLVRPAPGEPEGVGALRRFAVGPFGSIEEVVAWEPPRHLGYVARKGLPVRAYRADVHLHEDSSGTVVVWSGSLDPIIPGTGLLVLAYVRRLVRGFVKRLCRHADELARDDEQ